MPGGTPYPSGDIRVVDHRLQDISGAMRWYMPDASDVRFLAVNGTMTIRQCRAKYDFTLVVITCTLMKFLGPFSPHWTMH